MRETLKNFILSKKVWVAHYLCSETETSIGSGKEIKGKNMEYKRPWMRTELHI